MKRIQYNSPVILTFSIIVVAVHLVDLTLTPGLTLNYFMVRPAMSLYNPVDFLRLVSHVFGHSNWQHLFGNLTYVLLLGPILEEKYGSLAMLLMMAVTALSTGVMNVLLFPSGLLGASGIVFMLIILASVVDIRHGSIPLTFVLIAGIFIGAEIVKAFRTDNVSQMAHIVGGAVGAFFGFRFAHPS